MRLYAKDGVRGKLIDLDTGKPVPKVVWFDTETGEFQAYQTGADGQILRDAQGDYLVYLARGRLRFFPEDKPRAVRLPCPDPEPVTKPPRRTSKDERLDAWMLGILPCSHYACTRTAEWAVSDEEPAAPQIVDRMAYTQATIVNRRFFCAFHYKPPRLLDHKGEVVEEFAEAGGVRPQWHS